MTKQTETNTDVPHVVVDDKGARTHFLGRVAFDLNPGPQTNTTKTDRKD